MIRSLPADGESLLIRTDFSDDERWRATVEAASQSWDLGDGEDHFAAFTVVDDAAFDGLTLAELAEVIGSPPPYYVFLADSGTITDPEHSILAVDTADSSADYPTFRVHPSQMPAVENNLSLANMDFDDFSSAVGADGVFRGFEPPPTTRSLSKSALLGAIDRSTVSAEALTEYRAALEDWPRPDVDGNYVPDLRVVHDDMVSRRREYDHCSWLVGLDEAIDASRGGGEAVGFGLGIRGTRDRLPGFCSIYVHPTSLAPIVVVATGSPGGWPVR